MKKLFVLLMCVFSALGLHAEEYVLNGNTKLVVTGTKGVIEVQSPGDIAAVTNWSYPVDIQSALNGLTEIVVSGAINSSDADALKDGKFTGRNRVDFGGITGVQINSFDGNYKQLILPSGSSISTVPYNCEYIIVAGEPLTVKVQSGATWVNDPYVDAASSVNVSLSTNPSPYNLNIDNEITTLRETKEVNGEGGGADLVDLTIDANTENVSEKIATTTSNGTKIKKLTITGTMSDLTVLNGVEAKSVDLSGLTNTSIDGLKLPTTTGEIKLPGDVTYSNENVTIGSSTTLNQLSAALKVLKDNGKTFSSVPLPGGSTYANGTLTLSAADESNLSDVVSALKNAGLSVSTINFSSGTTYANGRLTTVAADDDTADHLKAKADQLTNAGFSITTVALSDKTTWENGVMTTKLTGTEQNRVKQKLNNAGFNVTSVVESSVSGEYVTEANGITTLTLPAGENWDTAWSKMTQEEKDALKNATSLKLVGDFTNDFSKLYDNTNTSGENGLQELDLSDAKMSTTTKIERWSSTLTKIVLPTDPSFTKVPDSFVENFTHLSTVVFPNQLTEIGAKAFKNTGLTNLKLTGSITSVGEQAFMECKNLERFEMEELTSDSKSCTFGASVFETCSSLKHVSLPEGLPEISEKMFDKCGQLESIRIPTTVEFIRSKAFEGCASLHSLIIPEAKGGPQKIEAGAFSNAGLAHIYVMATKVDKIPLIISLKSSDSSTFDSHQVCGDYNSPKESSHTPAEAALLKGEEILKWYQDDLSNSGYGIGGNNCLIQLHYPENMKDFYDGIVDPVNGGTAWSSSIESLGYGRKGKEKWAKMVEDNNTPTYLSEIYGLDSGAPDYPTFIDNDKAGWPTTPDYEICVAAGYASGYSNLGWRQFPLKKGASNEDFIYTKEYDDTWYTMCFPWDLEDNQLFSAFNQKCEITEFVGVEVTEDDKPETENVIEYSLVFHFDKVASTYYMTKNHKTDGLEYIRLSSSSATGKDLEMVNNYTRTDKINLSGVGEIEKKYYTYKLIKGSDSGYEYVYWPKDLPTENSKRTADQRNMCDRYEAILHLMVFAGHPYMIHPSIGASPGVPAACTFAGVTKISYKTQEEYDKLASDSAQYKIVTTDGRAYHIPGSVPFINKETNQGGSYYFIGNIRDKLVDSEGNVTDTGAKNMLEESNPAYYLSVGNGTNPYPKYYRKTTGGIGKWSQYSAIICPDAAALKNVEGLDGMAVGSGGSSAKAASVVFGEWEVVTPTAIDEIIADAEKNEQPVKKVHLNVVFNINGQVVREGTTSVEGLPKGLYIVNGKKYMVK